MSKTLIVGNWKMKISAIAYERGASPLIVRGSGINPHAPTALPYLEVTL